MWTLHLGGTVVPMEDPHQEVNVEATENKLCISTWNSKKIEGNKYSRPAFIGVHMLFNDRISTDSFYAMDAKRT